mmetsp:Transcript_55568/g.92042  ORF Transcript_55568/g.92042 Transcript_55568/m.92042 type:complete len:313 (-) Transcript_55568:206-1144(-)
MVDKVVLDVGGTLFHTSRSTLERTSEYFRRSFAQKDQDNALEDGWQKQTIFLDSDPPAFRRLLAYMRHNTTIGVFPPDDPLLFATLLAECEYYGLTRLLEHVKARTHRHMNGITDEFAEDDDLEAARKFDAQTGGWQMALNSGLLPARYFEPTPPTPSRRIVQLVPTSGKTYYVIGHMASDALLLGPGQADAMIRMSQWVAKHSGLVRKVACFALVQDNDGTTLVEPMVLLSSEDQEACMSGQPGHVYQDDLNPNFLELYPHEKRMLLASEYMRSPAVTIFRKQVELDKLWTHLIVTDNAPPPEIGIEHGPQ